MTLRHLHLKERARRRALDGARGAPTGWTNPILDAAIRRVRSPDRRS